MNAVNQVVKVGIADLKIATTPDILRTTGLGSCVGVVIYDLPLKLAGMAHVMLPDSTLTRTGELNKMKYADTAIDMLMEKLIAQGARKFALKAKIAGGAQMFSFSTSSDMMRVGTRNVEAVITRLKDSRIPIVAQEVGGNNGRTIEFSIDTGKLKIRTVNMGESEI
ncbi:chemotaxis protein CheD [Sediminibacillus albus]|uniref:Probable chemoreceptor glutamine deamidase CheD n=1 Tax=Sediminibacillus albus TaxID=407036 RepID=A0A1G8W1K4_9BACI|nr:chemotaxis protein CheD [Sediminibacillus albus]SDJ71976.1 chemotaxis protein CheD [Sediminibacillus albus]